MKLQIVEVMKYFHGKFGDLKGHSCIQFRCLGEGYTAVFQTINNHQFNVGDVIEAKVYTPSKNPHALYIKRDSVRLA